MRILVAIANHGSRNRRYVERLIATYAGFPYSVDVVVLSDTPKDFGPRVEVKVGLPSRDPWSLPFAHRPLFAERGDAYDLFIYSEDDTEVEQRHVDAFLAATAWLPTGRIAGFMRYECAPDGRRFCSTVHAHYHWDLASLLRAGGRTFARYGNDHAACYMLTRAQLASCIRSGGFLVPPHATRYDMLCSAATDPYTQCGFTKLVCISHLEDFLLHHLPDKYLGRIGVEMSEVECQVERLLRLPDGGTPPLLDLLHDPSGRRPTRQYYEPYRPEAVTLLPRGARRLLSVGCERGETEARLLHLGCSVTAVPMDDVIAASAERRGIRTTAPDLRCALEQLAGERFDGILFNNLLPYLRDPSGLVQRFRHLLAPGGCVIATFDNLSRLSLRRGIAGALRDQFAAGTLGCSAAAIAGWLRAADLWPDRVAYDGDGRAGRWARTAGGVAARWVAPRGAVRALGGAS